MNDRRGHGSPSPIHMRFFALRWDFAAEDGLGTDLLTLGFAGFSISWPSAVIGLLQLATRLCHRFGSLYWFSSESGWNLLD